MQFKIDALASFDTITNEPRVCTFSILTDTEYIRDQGLCIKS